MEMDSNDPVNAAYCVNDTDGPPHTYFPNMILQVSNCKTGMW